MPPLCRDPEGPSQKFPLELAHDEMRESVKLILDWIIQHFKSFEEAYPMGSPSHDLEGAMDLSLSLIESCPEKGMPLADLVNNLFQEYVPKGLNTAGPGYLGFIPGGGLFQSALADLIANAVNRFIMIPQTAPFLTQIECNTIRWFGQIVGYPEEARGALTTGGSQANFMAIVCARENRLPENFFKGTIYVSDQTHRSVHKAARLAGIPSDNLKMIPTDPVTVELSLPALERQIEEDVRNGLTPFLLIANAGTTNTGTIEPLREMASLAQKYGMWFHVDAAYGGFFMITERGRKALGPIHLGDSITLDPHKTLFLPYGTGALLVRDASAMRNAFSYTKGEYIPESKHPDELWDLNQLSTELSRDFRGLRVWLPLKMHGLDAFRKALDEKLDLAQQVYRALLEIPGIEVLRTPQLSLVAFRLNIRQKNQNKLNSLNQRLLNLINDRKRVFLSGTYLHRKYYLRICVLSFRTHDKHIQWAIEDLRAAVGSVL